MEAWFGRDLDPEVYREIYKVLLQFKLFITDDYFDITTWASYYYKI